MTLACSRINLASTTLISALFKDITAGPLITSIATFLLLKKEFDKSLISLTHFFNCILAWSPLLK